VSLTSFFYQLSGSSLDLLQEIITQHRAPAFPAIHSPVTISPSPSQQANVSRGIKAYPDGWQQILNATKDLVRSSILLDNPFPRPHEARVTATECFHEAYIAQSKDMVVEPGTIPATNATSPTDDLLTSPCWTGFSWGDGMLSIVRHLPIQTPRPSLNRSYHSC